MNLDTGLIKHWANLLECEEAKNGPVDEAGLSVDDIIKRSQEIKARNEKEREQEKLDKNPIEKIIVNSISPDDYSIEYTIVRRNGEKSTATSPGFSTDDEYYKKMYKTLKKMSDGTKQPDEYDVAVAMLRAPFDANSKTPIKWEYCNVGDESNPEDMDKEWYFRPSEDYFGWTPADIDAMVDSGWSHPMVR